MTSSFIADNAHQRTVVGQHIRDTFRGSRDLSIAVAYVEVNKVAAKRDIELPPSKVWHRYEVQPRRRPETGATVLEG